MPEVWARQEVAAIPETDFTQTVNPEPRWTLDAELPRVVDAPDLAASVEFLPAAPGAQPGALLPPMGSEGGVEALAREAERRLVETSTATPPPVDLT